MNKSDALDLIIKHQEAIEKAYKLGRKRFKEEIDRWFKGRGNMEKWEWEKLKKGD